MFVTAITMLLNTTGIELVTRREADLGRELKTLGVANLVASALGGYVSCVSLSRTTLTCSTGGRSRACGLVVAVVSGLMLLVDPAFLAYVPKFVLGGLLLYLGASLMYEWLVDAVRRISLPEYASLLAIAILIVQVGFIAGVLIGVIISCATFAVSASRVNAIKFNFDGSEYRSTLDRGPDELAILAAHGGEIQGMTELSVLRLSQPALSAGQCAVRGRAQMPLPPVRFPPRHRHRFLGHAQLHPDQAGGRRDRCATGAGQSLE